MVGREREADDYPRSSPPESSACVHLAGPQVGEEEGSSRGQSGTIQKNKNTYGQRCSTDGTARHHQRSSQNEHFAIGQCQRQIKHPPHTRLPGIFRQTWTMCMTPADHEHRRFSGRGNSLRSRVISFRVPVAKRPQTAFDGSWQYPGSLVDEGFSIGIESTALPNITWHRGQDQRTGGRRKKNKKKSILSTRHPPSAAIDRRTYTALRAQKHERSTHTHTHTHRGIIHSNMAHNRRKKEKMETDRQRREAWVGGIS